MNNLPESIASKQELDQVIQELLDYHKWYSHNAIKERTDARKGSPPPTLSPDALALIRSTSSNGQKLTERSLDTLIKKLQSVRSSAPTITITLAAPPTQHIKSTLTSWCRTHISDDILIGFEFNRTILGGMVVRSGSHIHDWSFKRALLANRDSFPEVLRRV